MQKSFKNKKKNSQHTIDDPRVGGGGAGTLLCGGNGGAILFVLTLGLRSFAMDRLFALPVPVVAAAA